MRHHMGVMTGMNGLEIVALADPSPDQIARSKSAHPALESCATYEDYRDMLSKGGIDAVIISTPHTQHTEQILDCYAAGLHVLSEKPLVTNVADAKKVIAARDKAGKVGAIAYQRHGTGAFQYIRNKVLSGEYGKVTGLNSHNSQSWLKGTKGTWRQDPALSGGGQLNDTGSHVVDVLMWVLDAKPTKVQAFIENRGAPVDIDSVVNIAFANGAIANITIMGSGAIWHERHHVWFEEAFMTLQNDRLDVFETTGRHFVFEGWPKASTPVHNFLAAINGEAEVLAPFECGLRTIEVTEAAWKSAEQGGQLITI